MALIAGAVIVAVDAAFGFCCCCCCCCFGDNKFESGLLFAGSYWNGVELKVAKLLRKRRRSSALSFVV